METTAPATPTPRELTGATTTPDIIDVPIRHVLCITGAGAPAGDEFAASLAALYGIAYGLKFARKKSGADFKIGVLAGTWWAVGTPAASGQLPPRDSWRWTLQLDMPSDVTTADVQAAIEAAVTRRGGKLEGSPHAARLELLDEPPGRYARILHVGSYADEPRSFAAVGELLRQKGLDRKPWHIEVYLSDPGRTAPEKLKTVLLTPLIAG